MSWNIVIIMDTSRYANYARLSQHTALSLFKQVLEQMKDIVYAQICDGEKAVADVCGDSGVYHIRRRGEWVVVEGTTAIEWLQELIEKEG